MIFKHFSFFLEILYFLCLTTRDRFWKKSDAKRNDHVFPKLNEPSWFLQIFVLENNIFHIFIFCFRIDTSMKLFITWFSKFLYLFPDWYTHETHFACNEELRHRGLKNGPRRITQQKRLTWFDTWQESSKVTFKMVERAYHENYILFASLKYR